MTAISPSASQPSFNITQLNPETLIYFDKIADVQMIQDEWKMVVFYNMTTYWRACTYIEKYVDHTLSNSQKQTDIIAMASQLKHDVSELQHFNTFLQTQHQQRYRRGLINGVGYIANAMFGVLDSTFAEKYEHDISSITKN
ncbi:unnamed protein product [Plutella xylostella]|uniref:(diamondback moth) hypothetical protein n=1 Tax=Plutella xylostella TaxID=51655 RepID=A0A8S4GD93_PLUXY|nr:unnamed protein product [Plutella xylostella]